MGRQGKLVLRAVERIAIGDQVIAIRLHVCLGTRGMMMTLTGRSGPYPPNERLGAE
jgi:hypothetical protein